MSDFTDSASRLCTACGLCCNGVLFQIVRLGSTDNAKDLEAHGLTLSRKKTEPYFRQPCTALNGCTCTIYAARPHRCRAFECRQIKALATGETSEAEAREVIIEAKEQVAHVESLLRELGDTDEHLPVGERVTNQLAVTPESLALSTAMQHLSSTLRRHFHSLTIGNVTDR